MQMYRYLAFRRASTAAALGIFMAGLGLGSLVLGRRADRAPRPLVFYAWLEAGTFVPAPQP